MTSLPYDVIAVLAPIQIQVARTMGACCNLIGRTECGFGAGGKKTAKKNIHLHAIPPFLKKTSWQRSQCCCADYGHVYTCWTQPGRTLLVAETSGVVKEDCHSCCAMLYQAMIPSHTEPGPRASRRQAVETVAVTWTLLTSAGVLLTRLYPPPSVAASPHQSSTGLEGFCVEFYQQ